MKDCIIIGSGPAGLSAAIYAKRAMMDITVLEKTAFGGGQIITTEQVDNYLGLPGISGFELGEAFRKHAGNLGVSVEEGEAASVEKLPDRIRVTLTDGRTMDAKTVLIATGARHRELGVPGEKEFAGAGVSYCATCDGAFFRNKEVAVVGGGDVALGDALYLSKICSKVHIIHRRASFRGAKLLAGQALGRPNVVFHKETQVKRIDGTPGKLTLTLDAEPELAAAGVFIAVGMLPVTEYLQGVVSLDEGGYVIAGEDCKTNVPGIFAAGDVRTKPVRQVATAVGDGASAVASIEAFLNEEVSKC